jgi:hypothetical protein
MLHFHPDLVDMDKATDFPSLQRDLAKRYQHLRAYGPVGFGWLAGDLNPAGAVGKAAAAMAQAAERRYGERIDEGLVITRYGHGLETKRIRVLEVRHERSYLTARTRSYETLDNLPDPSHRERVITLHMKLLELSGEKLRPSLYEGPKLISFVIAQNAGLDLARKQELLELRSEQDRLSYLADHLEQIIPEVERARERMRRVRSNGHFKEDQ